MLAEWEGGSVSLVIEQEARGRVLACKDIEALSLASIRQFYGIEGEQP